MTNQKKIRAAMTTRPGRMHPPLCSCVFCANCEPVSFWPIGQGASRNVRWLAQRAWNRKMATIYARGRKTRGRKKHGVCATTFKQVEKPEKPGSPPDLVP